jgi:hypothetical protein
VADQPPRQHPRRRRRPQLEARAQPLFLLHLLPRKF